MPSGLHRFFVVRLRDTALAEELVQDVFERVIRARDKFKPGHAFRPLALGHCEECGRERPPETAIGASRHEPRRFARARRPHHAGKRVGGFVALPTPCDGRPGAPLRACGDAIEQLEDDLREVLMLKHFDELPCREVAAILGVPEGTGVVAKCTERWCGCEKSWDLK